MAAAHLTEKIHQEVARARTWRDLGDNEEAERCNTRINELLDLITNPVKPRPFNRRQATNR